MERLTSNKKVSDMSMIELAHNSCYADDKRNAQYRDYEMDMDARDFARNLMVTLTKDELPISDTEFDVEILDDLAIDPFSDVRGLIALFYRNLWAMANLRETLKKYEDLEEQGLLLRLPYPLGTEYIYFVDEKDMDVYELDAEKIEVSMMPISKKILYTIDSYEFLFEDFKKAVFLTKSEAEAKLKELRGGRK